MRALQASQLHGGCEHTIFETEVDLYAANVCPFLVRNQTLGVRFRALARVHGFGPLVLERASRVRLMIN